MSTHTRLKEILKNIREHDIANCRSCKALQKTLLWHQTHQSMDPIKVEQKPVELLADINNQIQNG